MAQHKDNMPRHSDKKLTLLAVFVLFLTVSCLIWTMWAQDSSYQEEQPVAVVAAADSGSGPRVVGGFVPEKFHGPPAVRWEGNLLSWEFINGLFALIFALEFLIFPVLFWLWFGKEK